MKLYGSLNNRLMERRKTPELEEGMDITICYWSDRDCYFITKVINQKHILVHKYHICADHSKPGGQGHQDWVYFKTLNEQNAYLNKFFKDKEREDCVEPIDEEWVLRYNHWNRVEKYLIEGKEVIRYRRITEGLSFGVRSYYYDWEF